MNELFSSFNWALQILCFVILLLFVLILVLLVKAVLFRLANVVNGPAPHGGGY